jgi:hypothetical protein
LSGEIFCNFIKDLALSACWPVLSEILINYLLNVAR